MNTLKTHVNKTPGFYVDAEAEQRDILQRNSCGHFVFCQVVLNYQGEKTACAPQIGNCAGPCVSKSQRNKTKSSTF